MRFFRFTAPLLLFSHFSQAIETRQPMTADVYSLRPGIRSQHHQPLQPPHRTDGKKMGRDLYQAPPSAVSCIIGKTKCAGIQNQMRLFGG